MPDEDYYEDENKKNYETIIAFYLMFGGFCNTTERILRKMEIDDFGSAKIQDKVWRKYKNKVKKVMNKVR
jgi:hypothetical protein